MPGYYDDNLSAERLQRVYEIATPRVRHYLRAELEFVLTRIRPGDRVLELGCGYGRILGPLAAKAGSVVGIDTARASLRMARTTLKETGKCAVACMDAVRLGFRDRTFDRVLCIQNGISAFHVDQRALIREAIRVTRPGGSALFSSYAAQFWDDRLEWFRLQAAEGLLGAIDKSRTGNGIIVCHDGFTATTVTPEQFRALTDDLGYPVRIEEVDGSSLFCEIDVVE